MQELLACVHIIMHKCRTQHSRAVLIIFPLTLQTSTRAQMLSIGGKGMATGELCLKLCPFTGT